MAKVYISKSILLNKALNAFISCVSKHSLKQEFSSAVLREGPLLPHLREGRAYLTLLPSFCAAPSILFPGGIEAVGTFRVFFVTALVCSALLQSREKVWLHPCTQSSCRTRSRSSPQDQKMGIEATTKQKKSQELIQSCDYWRWVKKEECCKKQKEEGGGEGDRARVGFAWLDC